MKNIEKFKPVYDMTPEEIEASTRVAIGRQQELIQKMEARRAEMKSRKEGGVGDKRND